MSKEQEKRNIKSGSIGGKSNNGNKNGAPNKKEIVYPTREEALSVEAILAEKIGEFEARIERLEVWMTTPPPASALFKMMCRLAALEGACRSTQIPPPNSVRAGRERPVPAKGRRPC